VGFGMPGRIVYSRAQDQVWDLYEADPNGAGEAPLTHTNELELHRTAVGEVISLRNPARVR
jgi:hypothetical protein